MQENVKGHRKRQEFDLQTKGLFWYYKCFLIHLSKNSQLKPIKIQQKGIGMRGKPRGEHTWSLLLINPGFFFFFAGLGDVSEGECPFEECGGLGAFLFCTAGACSADPRSGTADEITTAVLLCKATWIIQHLTQLGLWLWPFKASTAQTTIDLQMHKEACLLCTKMSSKIKQNLSYKTSD